jgi:hypothetical protein
LGHAHHFLERLDRVKGEQLEFALELYRDHEAVAYVLDHVTLPEGTGRVALAIADEKEGPFVLVTREGRFVTCLGEGMHHDHPVVARPRLDALLGKVAEKRARKEFAQRELRPDEEEGDLFHRILARGSRFSREDFVAVTSFEPMLGLAPYMITMDIALEILKLRPAMAHGAHIVDIKGSTVKTFEKLDRLEWSIAHLCVLAGAAERRTLDAIIDSASVRIASPGYACVMNAGSTFFLRAAYFAARLGKNAIPIYKKAYDTQPDWMAQLDAGLGLGAIALRHSGTMAEVRRALSGYGPPIEGEGPPTEDRSRRNIAHLVLETLDKAEERTEIAIKMGRDFCVSYGSQLPEGHALRFEKPEDVPVELAKTALLAFDADIKLQPVQMLTMCGMTLAARAAPEDFYFPREVVRAWFGQWSPDETLERLKRFHVPKEGPMRAEAKPGRNDPCHCGSGKKFKKCHGGPNPPS